MYSFPRTSIVIPHSLSIPLQMTGCKNLSHIATIAGRENTPTGRLTTNPSAIAG